MDKLNQYRVLIEEILGKYSEIKLSYGEIEIYPFFDGERDHYQIFEAGWNKYTRVFCPLIHIDIWDGKIWIQHDGTEVGIANELV